MRIMTLTIHFSDLTTAEVVHRTNFPAAKSAPVWSGNTAPLPPELLTQERTQDGLAGRCEAVALELGATVTVAVEGGYLYAD